MSEPGHRRQFDNARDPYAARNALQIVNWKFLDNGSGQVQLPTGDITFKAGSNTTLTISNQTVTIAASGGGGGGVSSINTLTGALTIAAGAGINLASAGTTITISAPLFGTGAQGEVPASGGGTTNFLRADGAWAAPPSGGGNVSNSGTPTSGQYAKWTDATHIQGVATATVLTDIGAQPLDATLTALAAYNTNGLLTQTAADTFTGRTLTGPAAGITVSNGSGVAGNPTLALANDLAALEALSGTNTIYYRSGADTWSAVTIGTNLTFSGGTLSASGGGTSGLVLLNTLTASSSASIADTSNFTSTYDSYELELLNILPALATPGTLKLEIYTSGAYATTGIYSAIVVQSTSDSNSNAAYFLLSGVTNLAVPSNATSPVSLGVSGLVRMHGVNSGSVAKYVEGNITYLNSGGGIYAAVVGGYSNTTAAITGIRLSFTNGNIASGKVRIYGRST